MKQVKSSKISKILFTTSTLPASDTDPVPAFVKDEAIWFKKKYPELEITILAPHNAHSQTKSFTKHKTYDEYRFHYFWPFGWEKLTGRGIAPALKQNKLLYIQVPFLFIFEFIATWRMARKTKPDLLYAHWFTPQAMTAYFVSKLTGIPMVFDTQSSDVIVLKKVPFAKHIVASVCRHAKAYTAPTNQTKVKLLYFSNPNNQKEIVAKLHIVPLGTTPVPVSQHLIDEVKEKYQLTGHRVVYFIGRLVDRKGIDVLIKAFKNLYDKDKKLRLIIVGDGQEKEKFTTLAKELGLTEAIIFTGYLTGTERFALLNAADIGVVPSVNVGDHAEGLPIVFMEGITAGKAMVVSDASGAHEVVKDGDNAFVVRAGSVKDLTNKMQAALSINARQDKKFYQNVKLLSKKFQWPTIIKQRYDIFSQIND